MIINALCSCGAPFRSVESVGADGPTETVAKLEVSHLLADGCRGSLSVVEPDQNLVNVHAYGGAGRSCDWRELREHRSLLAMSLTCFTAAAFCFAWLMWEVFRSEPAPVAPAPAALSGLSSGIVKSASTTGDVEAIAWPKDGRVLLGSGGRLEFGSVSAADLTIDAFGRWSSSTNATGRALRALPEPARGAAPRRLDAPHKNRPSAKNRARLLARRE